MISCLVRNEIHCLTLMEDGAERRIIIGGSVLFLLQPEAMITLKLNTPPCCSKMSLTVSCEASLQRPVDGRECALRNLMASKIFFRPKQRAVFSTALDAVIMPHGNAIPSSQREGSHVTSS